MKTNSTVNSSVVEWREFADYEQFWNKTNETLNYTDEESVGQCVHHIYDPEYPDWTQIVAVHYLFVFLYLLVMVLALLGNSMVIWTVWRHKSMHTATNYYIVSLAVSDFFLSIFVLPTKLMEVAMDANVSPFKDNVALCSVLSFLQPIFVFASVWTLVAVSVDRYLAIMHPLKARSFGTKSRARKIIITIWIVGCLLMTPYLYPSCLYFYYLESEYGAIYRIICTPKLYEFSPVFVKGWHIFFMLILYFFPLTLLCICYGIMATRLMRMTKEDRMLHTKDFQHSRQSRSRRKLAKMVIVVVIVFCTCWAPCFISSMVTIFKPVVFQNRNFMFAQVLYFLFGFANSSMNPIIYAIMSEKFREGFKHIGILVFTCRQHTSSTYIHRLARNTTFMSSGRSSVDKDDHSPQESSGAFGGESSGRTNSSASLLHHKRHHLNVRVHIDPPGRGKVQTQNVKKVKPSASCEKSGKQTHTFGADANERNNDVVLRKLSSSPRKLRQNNSSNNPTTSDNFSTFGHSTAGSCGLYYRQQNKHLKQLQAPSRIFVPVVHYGDSRHQCNYSPAIVVNERKALSSANKVTPQINIECVDTDHRENGSDAEKESQSLKDIQEGDNIQQDDNTLEDKSLPLPIMDPRIESPRDAHIMTALDNPEDANYVCLSLIADKDDLCYNNEDKLSKFACKKFHASGSCVCEIVEDDLSSPTDELDDPMTSSTMLPTFTCHGSHIGHEALPTSIYGCHSNMANYRQVDRFSAHMHLNGSSHGEIQNSADSTGAIYHVPRDTTDDFYYHGNDLLSRDPNDVLAFDSNDSESEIDPSSVWKVRNLENAGQDACLPPIVYITNV